MQEGPPLGGALEPRVWARKAWFIKENQQCVVVHALDPSTWDKKFKFKQAGLHEVLSQSDKTKINENEKNPKKKRRKHPIRLRNRYSVKAMVGKHWIFPFPNWAHSVWGHGEISINHECGRDYHCLVGRSQKCYKHLRNHFVDLCGSKYEQCLSKAGVWGGRAFCLAGPGPGYHLQHCKNWVWWWSPIILALGC